MSFRSSCLFLVLFLLFTYSDLSAQTIRVVDDGTSAPVENVYIYNNGRNIMTSTNSDGQASLKKFSSQDTLNFQHPAYHPLSLTYQQIIERDNRVQLSERAIAMEEIYVSASKREQDLTEIPQKITQINREQALFGNPQTTADLLDNSGKVFVQKSQLGGGSPMIRGFAANSVLLAVDGVRMNNAIFRSGNLQNVISIDANALEQTEVLFGPGSIIYGSDALGGVMNFQTKDPALALPGEEMIFDLNTLARFSSANDGRTFHADAAVGGEKWGGLTSISYSYFDDLRSGGDFYEEFPDFGKRQEYVVRRDGADQVLENEQETLQRFSGYEQLNLMQKIRYRPSDDWNTSYGFHYATTGDIPRYDRLIEREQGDSGPLVNAEWYYGPQIWMMNNAEINYSGRTTLFDNFNAVLAHQWFQESRNDRDFGDPMLRNREENINMYSANLDFDKYWSGGRELFYGVEGLYNYVGSAAYSQNIETGNRMPVATRYPDGGSDYWQWAAYAKYQQDLTDRLTAVTGLRYSHVLLHSDFNNTQFYQLPFNEIEINAGALNGTLGFTYRPLEDLQFNLNGATGFRAPNVDDAAKVFDSEPGTVVVPNADLQPEYSYNLDFSVIKDFNDRARLEVNTYYTWLREAMVRREFQFNGQDEIVYDGEVSEVEAVVNAGKAYIYGASIGLSAELNRLFSFNSQVTYTYGRDQSNNEPLRHVAPLFGLISMTYQAGPWKVQTYTEFNAHKPISEFSPSERSKTHLYTPDGTPGWATLNLKGSYRFNDRIQLLAGLENLLDRHYRPYSSGISAPGRNISISLRAQL